MCSGKGLKRISGFVLSQITIHSWHRKKFRQKVSPCDTELTLELTGSNCNLIRKQPSRLFLSSEISVAEW